MTVSQTIVAHLRKRLEETAQDVLTMAADGGMPETYWVTDQRIQRACVALGWSHEKAREWARQSSSR